MLDKYTCFYDKTKRKTATNERIFSPRIKTKIKQTNTSWWFLLGLFDPEVGGELLLRNIS
jgi:hypothetical protein